MMRLIKSSPDAYSLRVRAVTRDDLGQVSQMLRLSWLETYTGSFGTDLIHKLSDQWHTPERLERDLIAPGNAFPIVQDLMGRIVGTAYGRPEARVRGSAPDHVMLHRLYVLRGWQGQKLGKRLITFVAASSAQLPWQLEVAEANLPAKRFYARLGFRELKLLNTCGPGAAQVATRVMRTDGPLEL